MSNKSDRKMIIEDFKKSYIHERPDPAPNNTAPTARPSYQQETQNQQEIFLNN